MNRIRIGNDIKLVVKLLGTNTYDPINININYVKAYIINTTLEEKQIAEYKNKTRFISRFPIEPMIDAYTSSSCNINSSGYPTYHAYPQNHVIAPYAGFGVNPSWDRMYKPIPQHNLTEFRAPVKATHRKDVINIFFPAEAQLFPGTYKIVIVAKLYYPGFNPNNLRTVTMDYENIFVLTNTSEDGVDSAVTLEVGITDSDTDDLYATAGELDKKDGKTTVRVDMSDGMPGFHVDISPETDWYEGN